MTVKYVEGNIPMSDNERAYREYLLAEKMREFRNREDIIDRDTFFESLDAELDGRVVEWNNEEIVVEVSEENLKRCHEEH